MSQRSQAFTSDNPSLSLPIQTAAGEHSWQARSAAEIPVGPLRPLDGPVQLIADVHSADIRTYLHAAISENTRRAYAADVASFVRWGGKFPATDEDIAEYLVRRADEAKPSSLKRALVGIRKAHRLAGYADPTKSEVVRAVLRGVCRVKGTNAQEATPILREDMLLISDTLGKHVAGLRDRALLLLGFAGGFRRSELVQLDMADIAFVPEGLLVVIRRSKTDQEGQGRKVGIPYGRTRACPVQALSARLGVSQLVEGPLFRSVTKGGTVKGALSAQSVGPILRRAAVAAGLSAAGLSAHSLRAGLVTSAVRAGVSTWKIKQQTGHRSDAVVAMYVRDAEIFSGNAAGALL